MESHHPWSTFLVLSLCAILFCRGSDLITADKAVSASDGKTAVLKCSYNGNREVNSVKWTKKSSNKLMAERSVGADYLTDSRINFVESSGKTNGSLIISPVYMRDTGTYTCGYDVQGLVPVEKVITLNVTEPGEPREPESPIPLKIVLPIVVIGLSLLIAGIVYCLYKKGYVSEETCSCCCKKSEDEEEDQKGPESKRIKWMCCFCCKKPEYEVEDQKGPESKPIKKSDYDV